VKLIYYRLLSVFLIIDFLCIFLFLSLKYILLFWVSVVLFFAIIFIQITFLKCHHCGSRPGYKLLAIWTLLFDYELFFYDILFLKECPNCFNDLKEEP